jgi:hypothetical protein
MCDWRAAVGRLSQNPANNPILYELDLIGEGEGARRPLVAHIRRDRSLSVLIC